MITRGSFQIAILGVLVSAACVQGMAQSPPQSADYPFTVQRTGHGRPIILIPGLMSSGDVWSGAVAHLPRRRRLAILGFVAGTIMGGLGIVAAWLLG